MSELQLFHLDPDTRERKGQKSAAPVQSEAPKQDPNPAADKAPAEPDPAADKADKKPAKGK